MQDEISLAFDHPLARAQSTGAAEPLDRISLRDHVVAADIGAFQQERGNRQRLRFNVVVEIRPHPETLGDDVDLILSYDKVTEAIATELEAERLNLLETLAERIAGRVLAEPQALRVFLRIEKLDRGPGALGVEIVRARRPDAVQDADNPVPHPVVALTGVGEVTERRLAAILSDTPVVLCPGFPDLPRPQVADAAAQRRIDLLALEQAAWCLAAKLPEYTVVATRTEIDWALRHGKKIVWAPGKLVLDSPDSPETTDPFVLALWLAQTLQASALALPSGHDAPETSFPTLRF